MIKLYFLFNIVILILIWWYTFSSKLWKRKLSFQLVLFILPILFGLLNLVIIFNSVSLEIIKTNRYYIYSYSSITLILLIPQWYKLAWTQLIKARNKPWKDTSKLIFVVIFSVFMVFSMVIFFAMYYLWIYSIAGEKQSLLAALQNYQPVNLDFATSLYFSFVTYFTLGYGDLIPHGFWMRTFVFIECLTSVLNTGIIVIYVYNFLFYKQEENKHGRKITKY